MAEPSNSMGRLFFQFHWRPERPNFERAMFKSWGSKLIVFLTWHSSGGLCGKKKQPTCSIVMNDRAWFPLEQRFLVGRFSLYKVCLVKCWRRHFACARRLFVGILRMLVNIFFCVGGVGGSVLLWYCKLCFVVVIWDVGFHNLVYQYPEVQKTQPQLTTLAPTASAKCEELRPTESPQKQHTQAA